VPANLQAGTALIEDVSGTRLAMTDLVESGGPVIALQFTKDDLEALGLVRLDISPTAAMANERSGCARCLEFEQEIRVPQPQLAAVGQYVTYLPGPNSSPNVEDELRRWLAASPQRMRRPDVALAGAWRATLERNVRVIPRDSRRTSVSW
jgi:hypothetical protein